VLDYIDFIIDLSYCIMSKYYCSISYGADGTTEVNFDKFLKAK
jgi:hypothetical protein